MANTLKKLSAVFLLLQLLFLSVFAAGQVQIRADAPSQYEVIEGDTLWDISGRFLEDPWLWPEVWELNPQIENPNLIYPGDIIGLEYSAAGPILTLRRGGSAPGGLRTVILSPQIRREPLGSAISAIPLDRISSMLSANIIISDSELENSPYLLDNRSGKLFASENDIVFARGNWQDNIIQYDIVRAGGEFIDPDSGLLVGREGLMIGSATLLERDGENATIAINELFEEARIGDRFVPGAGNRIDANYFPEPPSFFISASIIDIGSGKSIGGLYDTIVINKGSSDRLQVGNLLALQKPDIVIEDQVDEPGFTERLKRAVGLSDEHIVTFSGEKFASVLIYRVFDNASLGIILSANKLVRIEDTVVTP